MIVFVRQLLIVTLLTSLSACSNFRHLKNDLLAIDQKFDQYDFDISLSKSVAQQPVSPLVLVSLSDNSAAGIKIYRLLGKAGRIKVYDSSDLVAFFIFKDTNQDLIYQSDEPFDWVDIDRSDDDQSIVVNMNIRTVQEHS